MFLQKINNNRVLLLSHSSSHLSPPSSKRKRDDNSNKSRKTQNLSNQLRNIIVVLRIVADFFYNEIQTKIHVIFNTTSNIIRKVIVVVVNKKSFEVVICFNNVTQYNFKFLSKIVDDFTKST